MLELREALGMRLQRLEIVAPRRQLQERQRAVLAPAPDLVERGYGTLKLAVERGLRQAALDLGVEGFVDGMRIERP